MTHFDKALDYWQSIQTASLDFGREAILSIQKEGKTIRDISIALCGDESLEDRIGRYIMAARFADSLDPQQYEVVMDYLTTAHFTELDKIERKYDRPTALDLMQDCVSEQAGGVVLVRSVEWLRARRGGDEIGTDELIHRFWMRSAKVYNELLSVLARKGNDATRRDRRRVRIIEMVIREFQAEAE